MSNSVVHLDVEDYSDNRTFPCMEATYPLCHKEPARSKQRPVSRGLYGIRELAPATLWSSRPMRVDQAVLMLPGWLLIVVGAASHGVGLGTTESHGVHVLVVGVGTGGAGPAGAPVTTTPQTSDLTVRLGQSRQRSRSGPRSGLLWGGHHIADASSLMP